MQPIAKTRNPFVNSLIVPYTLVIKERKIINGEHMMDTFEYENEPHFRVYNSKAKREFIFSLSMYARDMFMAIQYFTHAANDYVVLRYDKMKDLLKDSMYGKRRYEDTIRELIREGVIDYKDKTADQFWFNPNYFSPANRLKLFPECKLKTETKQLF